MSNDLKHAWNWRISRGLLEKFKNLRVFHGPGEGSGGFERIAIDRYFDESEKKSHYWITDWGTDQKTIKQTISFLELQQATSVVVLARPERGVPERPVVVFGKPPTGRFEVREKLGASFYVQMAEVKHPGLFLDHAPLRFWLQEHSMGWRVLNTFAYTGSLSVASALGGAKEVTTLDLSKLTVQWALDNWKLNGLPENSGYFISGDVFEWLPRLKREGKEYDCIILDPPSFSHGKTHGKKGNFSTAKDLTRLHVLAMNLLAPEGVLITSINSANVTKAKMEADIMAAAKLVKREFEIIFPIELSEAFPTRLGRQADRYLKGWVLKCSSLSIAST